MLLTLSLLSSLTPAPSIAAAPQDAWFDQPELLLDGSQVTFRGVGDFDGDGAPDLLSVAEPGATTLVLGVHLNDGSGRFDAPLETALPISDEVVGLPALGDFDSDGTLDVCVLVVSSLDHFTRELRLLRGVGDGTLGAPTTVVGAEPRGGIVAMEFDGDAGTELAFSATSGIINQTTFVYDWDGSGLVEAGQGPIVGDAPYPLVAADINGDGLDELLTYGAGFYLVANPGGGLGAGPKYVAVPGSAADSDFLGAFFGDADGDGDRDLLAVTTSVGALAVDVLENGGAGQFTQLPTQTLPLPDAMTTNENGSSAFSLVDWNGDGSMDLLGQPAVSFDPADESAPVLLLTGRADGTFDPPLAQPARRPRPHAGVLDLDGDGAPELVTASSILETSASFQGLADEVAALIPLSERIWDHDADGDLDLQLRGHATYSNAEYAVNDGTGGLSTKLLFPNGLGPGDLLHVPYARGDFDGDGRTELVGNLKQTNIFELTLVGLWRYELVPGLGFEPQGQAGPAAEFLGFRPFAADVDDDGDLDVVDENTWRLGDGTGSFGAPVVPFAEAILDVGDVDGDGDADFLTRIDGAVDELVLRRTQSPGVYLRESLLFHASMHASARLLDVDGDGDLDAVAPAGANAVSNERIFVFENASGILLQVADLPAVAGPEIRGVALDDVNGDGVRDLLAITAEGGVYQRLFAYPVLAGGLSFGAGRTYLTWYGSNLADVDADGDLDVLGSVVTHGLSVTPPASGVVRQYGAGAVGTGGARPHLGATGPLQAGSTTASIRLVGGLGSGTTLLVLGTAPEFVLLNDLPIYVGGALQVVPLVLGGAPGEVGAGEWILPLGDPGVLAGLSFYFEAFVVDPGAAFTFAVSNGLEMTFGL